MPGFGRWHLYNGPSASNQLGEVVRTVTSDGKVILYSSTYNGGMGLVIKIPGDDGIAGSL